MKLLEKLFDNIEFKGKATSIVLKMVVSILGTAVIAAFMIGQYQSTHLSKLNTIERLTNQSIKEIGVLNVKVDRQFVLNNAKIDKIYDDGILSFKAFNEFHSTQLSLVLKFGKNNGELLKDVLDLNAKEKAKQIEDNIMKMKRNQSSTTVNNELMYGDIGFDTEFKPLVHVSTDKSTGLSQYNITGAPRDYLNSLDTTIYKLVYKKQNHINEYLYDFGYKDKIVNIL